MKFYGFNCQIIKLAILGLLVFSLSGCQQSCQQNDEVAEKRPRVKNTPEAEQTNSANTQSPTSPVSNTQNPPPPVPTATATPQPTAKPVVPKSANQPTSPPTNCVVTGANNTPLRVRSNPGGNVIGSFQVGADIVAYDLVKDRNGENWTMVKYKGGYGYVSTQFISCG